MRSSPVLCRMPISHASRRRARPTESHAPRPGFALVYAIICLGLVTMIGISVTRLIAAAREQQQQAQRQAQVDWLLEAGQARALAQWQRDTKYAGERWHINPADWPHPDSALVDITISPPTKPDAPPALPRTITIVAHYPTEKTLTVRRTKIIPLPRAPL